MTKNDSTPLLGPCPILRFFGRPWSGIAFSLLLFGLSFGSSRATDILLYLNPADRGTASEFGSIGGADSPYDVEHLVTNGQVIIERDFFVFEIPAYAGVITAAELEIPAPDGTNTNPSFQSSTPTVTYEVHSLSIPIDSLTSNTQGSSVYTALATGTPYGEVKMTAATKVATIPLNTTFLADANSARGSSIALAGTLDVGPSVNVIAFTGSIGYTVTLRLTTEPPPGVTTLAPQQVGSSSALFSAGVVTSGFDMVVTFLVDGVKVGSVNVPGTEANATVSLAVNGLTPGASHVLTTSGSPKNSTYTSQGGPMTFQTLNASTSTVASVGGVEAATGAAAPGAGTFSGIPADASFATFGLPAIDATGAVAFATTFAGAKPISAIFAPTAPGVEGPLAATGGDFPGVSNVVYSKLSDPVVGGPAGGSTGSLAFGKTAFLATLSGLGVTKLNNIALLSTASADGSLAVLARTGESLLGNPVAAILSFAVDGSGNPCAVVRYATGNGVTAANSIAFVQWVSGSPSLLVRQGDSISFGDNGTPTTKTVASIAALLPAGGSPGAARGPVLTGNGLPVCRVTFTKDGSQAILRGESDVEAYTGGQPLYAMADEEFLTFGYPAGGPIAGFSAAFKVQGKVKAGRNAVLIVPEHDGTTFPVRQYATAYSLSGAMLTNLEFASFFQPVGGEDNGLAFTTRLTGTGVTAANQTAVFWYDGDGFLWLVGRTGEPAPGIYTATLASVSSVALLPGYNVYGPVFVGTLSGAGVTAANATALFGSYPSTDQMTVVTDKLLRTGDSVMVGGVPRTVAAISALQGSAGSLAQGRGYNGLGQMAVRVGLQGLPKSSQAIVITTVP